MEEVTKDELINISGGASRSKWGTIGVIIGIVATFLSGLLDGYLRPLSCNS